MIPTTINGRWELLLPEHRSGQWSRYTGWEPERINSMHANLKPGDVVYDVGAEEGDLPALWAKWGCHVAMFEPSQRVWANIKAIWEANGLPGPLLTFAGFAGDQTEGGYGELGKVESVLGRDGEWPASAAGEVITDHGFSHLWERPDIPKIRIDDLLSTVRPPQALTIDVEGSEDKVLAGAQETLRAYRPLVWVSVHPEFMAQMYGQRRDDLLDRMIGLGYRARLLAVDHEEHWAFDHPEGRTLQ